VNLEPSQRAPNAFESAVLHEFSKAYPTHFPNIQSFHVLSRKYTGVGCLIEFSRQEQFAESTIEQFVLQRDIFIPILKNGLMAVLLISENIPISLEIVSYDEPWDGTFEGFEIHE
jgi:hypothetical protein